MSCYPEESKARAGVGEQRVKKPNGFTSSFKQAYSFTTALVIADDTYELGVQGQG